MKKLVSALLTLALAFSLSAPAFAAGSTQETKADALYSLGLFLGTGNKNGVPQYELNGNLTRSQAVVLLVRMLGKEEEALKGNYTHPFKDTEGWYDKYVGYAYANKLTNGTGSTTYSGSDATTAEMFATFCLRTLGYNDSAGDFVWSEASKKAAALGITVDTKGAYLRGDAVETFWDALNTKMKGSKTLAEKLEADGVFTKAAFENAAKIEQGGVQQTTSGGASGSSGGNSGSSGNGNSSGNASGGSGGSEGSSGGTQAQSSLGANELPRVFD